MIYSPPLFLPISFFHLDSMAFSEFLNRGHARPGYGADPFSGVEMPLHEDVADGLINVAEGKHQKEGRMEIEVGEIHERKHHEVHKRNLQNGTESRISCGTVGVVLGPVSHTDNGGNAVDEEHAGADPVGLPGKSQGMKERIVNEQKDETGHTDDAAAEINEPFRSLKGRLVISGPDFGFGLH